MKLIEYRLERMLRHTKNFNEAVFILNSNFKMLYSERNGNLGDSQYWLTGLDSEYADGHGLIIGTWGGHEIYCRKNVPGPILGAVQVLRDFKKYEIT